MKLFTVRMLATFGRTQRGLMKKWLASRTVDIDSLLLSQAIDSSLDAVSTFPQRWTLVNFIREHSLATDPLVAWRRHDVRDDDWDAGRKKLAPQRCPEVPRDSQECGGLLTPRRPDAGFPRSINQNVVDFAAVAPFPLIPLCESLSGEFRDK